MNFVELLQEIINKFETCQQINLQNDRKCLESLTNQSLPILRKTIDNCEQILDLVAYSVPILVHVKDYYQETKIRLAQTEEAIDIKQQEKNHLNEEILKLKSHISQLQMRQERYDLEISALCERYKKQEQQFQEKQKDSKKKMDYLQHQNMELHQQIETMVQKFRNLGMIIKSQGQNSKELQKKLQSYSTSQQRFKQEIIRLNEQFLSLQAHYQHVLQQKNLKINYLQQFVSQKMNQCLQTTPYQPFQSYDNPYNQYFQQISTQQKLLMLSQQIQCNEKQLVNLQSFKNSKQPSINNEPNNKIVSKFLEALADAQNSSIRRVSSSIELYNGKAYKGRNIQSHIIIDNPFVQITLGGDKKIQPISQSQSNRADFSFKKQEEEESQIIKAQNTKIYIDTQITEREQGTVYDLKTEYSSKKVDPYYIHYLLMVQTIKIQQDEDGIYGILEIDMKPYYEQLKNNFCLSSWPNWIKQKLLQIHELDNDFT